MRQRHTINHDEQVQVRPGHRVARVGNFKGEGDVIAEGEHGEDVLAFGPQKVLVKVDVKVALLNLRPHVGHFREQIETMLHEARPHHDPGQQANLPA